MHKLSPVKEDLDFVKLIYKKDTIKTTLTVIFIVSYISLFL